MRPINLADKFARFDARWSPRIVAAANGQLIKLAIAEGEMPWHSHAEEDEFFLVLEGELTIEMREASVTLAAGECFVVPRGCEHKPSARVPTRFMLIEPASTAHTGGLETPMTVPIEDQEWL